MAAERRVHRRVDRRLLDPGSVDGVDPFYLPEAGSTFELPSFWVDDARLHLFEHRCALPLVERHRVLFFVHPLALKGYRSWLEGCAPGPKVHATPTSSTRTVFAWGDDFPAPFCVKLSLPVLFAQERRVVSAESARDAVAVTRALAAQKRGLRILPETLGVVPRDVDLGGYLVRELPRGVKLTPWFALERPQAHLAAFLRAWMTSALDDGWVADVHAQNLLFGGGRYWVRDLDSVWLEDDELEGARTSLHTYFLGGPARRHRRQFFRELEKYAGKAARDADAFAQWLADERHLRSRAPRPPRRVRRFLQREQTQNPRRRDPKRFAKVSLDALPRRFRPEHQPVWRLPYFVAPLERVKVYGRGRPRALFAEGGVRVFFHPHMAEAYGLDVLEYGKGTQVFWATPTASPRSVVVWNDDGEPFGLKLSLDVELLGINRLVHDSKLQRAVANCAAMRNVRFLAEPVAVRTEEKDYGFIYRELPEDLNDLTPGFALKLKPEVHFPALVNAFAELALGQGLVGDLHQQNVLFTSRNELVVRDLDSFKRDKSVHQAWTDELRAEWVYLAGGAGWQLMDSLLFDAVERYLGKEVVDAERAELRRRGWKTLYMPGDPSEPLYSLDAMLHHHRKNLGSL